MAALLKLLHTFLLSTVKGIFFKVPILTKINNRKLIEIGKIAFVDTLYMLFFNDILLVCEGIGLN